MVFCFPQCNRYGWRWCTRLTVCLVRAWLVFSLTCYDRISFLREKNYLMKLFFIKRLFNGTCVDFLMIVSRIPGIIIMLLSWVVTFYSLWQLVELHEVVPGKRFDRYPELGQHAFGQKFGYWFVMPQQLLVQVACDIVYMVTGGKSLKKFFDLLIPSFSKVRQTYYILFFACVQFVLSQTPNFNSLKGISLLAAIMSIGYNFVVPFY